VKPEPPEIPGLHAQGTIYTGEPSRSGVRRLMETLNLAGRSRNAVWGIALAGLGLLGFFAMKMSLGTSRGDAEQTQNSTPIGTSSTAASQPPYASPATPVIATLTEVAEPWSSKKFFFRRDPTSAYVPALLVRLPGKPAADGSYWAFGLDVPFSRCQYEYLVDLERLSAGYEFPASHPMVGNPCTHSVFDPLQRKEVPGNYLVRGAIVRGWDTRPPYEIEVRVNGNEIHAMRME
jgi:hypothetical protein